MQQLITNIPMKKYFSGGNIKKEGGSALKGSGECLREEGYEEVVFHWQNLSRTHIRG